QGLMSRGRGAGQDEHGLAVAEAGRTYGLIGGSEDLDGDEEGVEPIPQDTLVCGLTGAFMADKPEERVLQSFIEQLHREYRVELADIERDVRVPCLNAAGKKRTIKIGIAVYEHGKPHDLENITRVVLVAK